MQPRETASPERRRSHVLPGHFFSTCVRVLRVHVSLCVRMYTRAYMWILVWFLARVCLCVDSKQPQKLIPLERNYGITCPCDPSVICETRSPCGRMGRGLAYGTYIIAWPASSECFVPIDNNITSEGFRGGYDGHWSPRVVKRKRGSLFVERKWIRRVARDAEVGEESWCSRSLRLWPHYHLIGTWARLMFNRWKMERSILIELIRLLTVWLNWYS